MESKRPRGPIGKSCLTCKRRHKKCDQSRPKCNRCIKGGYECSYEHNERASSSRAKPSKKLPAMDYSPQSSDSFSPLCDGCDVAPEFSSMVADDFPATREDHEPLSSNANTTHDALSPEHGPIQTQADQSRSAMQVVAAKHPSLPSSFDSAIIASDIRIPSSIVLLSPDSWRLINYVMAQYDRMLKFAYFKPIQRQLTQYRSTMLLRLQSSSITRRTKLISFKVCEAILTGDDWRYQTIFKGWIQLLEQELSALWKHNDASQATERQLDEALDVSYVKSMLLSDRNTYQYLRYTAPTFLHAVFSDAAIWPDGYQLTTIPLARVLASPRCELGHFVFMDILHAMAYGLPQLVDYDTFTPSESDGVNGYSWSHGCPTKLQMALVDINMCRDRLPLAHNWQEIEHTLLAWEPQRDSQNDEWESWMTIAWFALQESWRHTLLVYLYMAAGDMSSDDPRVQASVRQISQVIKTIRQPEPPAASLQLFAQYLMVGVCARTENQRTTVREKLANSIESRAWMVGGTCFVPVLDHLWNGAAFGGQSIKWSDYVNSRETMLPVLQ